MRTWKGSAEAAWALGLPSPLGQLETRATEAMAVGQREEQLQQKVGKGLPPPRQKQTPLAAPETLLKGSLCADLETERNCQAGE